MQNEFEFTKSRARSLFSYFFVIFFDNFSFSINFIVFAPLFFSSDSQIVPVEMGQIARNICLGVSFAAFPLFQLVGAPILGDFADLRGRKKALSISVLGLCFSFILSAVAVRYCLLPLFIASRCISGFFSASLSICLAGIADLYTLEKKRGKHYGFVVALMATSWILAMMYTGAITNSNALSTQGPSLIFISIACLIFMNFLVVQFFLKETHVVTRTTEGVDLFLGLKNIALAFKSRKLRRLYFIYFLWILAWGSSIQWLQAYTLQNLKTSGNFFILFMIIFGVFRLCSSSFFNVIGLKYFSSYKLAKICLAATGLLVCSQMFVQTFSMFALIFCIAGLFSAIALSNILNLISLQVGSDIQGRVQGVIQSSSACGWIIGSCLSMLIFSLNSLLFYFFQGVLLLIAFYLLATVNEGVEP